MKPVIHWAVRNSPSMNTLMLAVIVGGVLAMFELRRERFPESRAEVVRITVPYPGASPEQVEKGICLRIEEAIRAVNNIRKITSVAHEGRASVSAELDMDVDDPHKVLNEIRSAVEQISTLPEQAEKPRIALDNRYRNVISVAVAAPKSADDDLDASLRDREALQLELRYLSEQVRQELLALPAVTHISSWHAKPYQIDVEISEDTLRRHGLTHEDVTVAIRAANIEVPAGNLNTDQTDYLLRISNRELTGDGIGRIPVLHRDDGTVLTVADLGTVHDGFKEIDVFGRVDGRLALTHEVIRTWDQDMFEIYEQVKSWVEQKSMPDGFDVILFNDYSRQARKRLDLLRDNAVFGLGLVFLMLALFLHGRLAFWVAVGIPVALCGTCGVMLLCGATINMYSMFAFVMALGIVVDDAIVLSENVYRHRQSGKSALKSAIDGAAEVAPSVISSVLTTVIAFLPLMWVSGEIGKRIASMPLVVVSMLLISLVEGLFILPCHLSHLPEPRTSLLSRLPNLMDRVLQAVIERAYLPTLRWCLKRPAIAISSSIAVVMLTVGAYRGGFTQFVLEKKLDWAFVYAFVDYPAGTPPQVIDRATRQLEDSLHRVDLSSGADEADRESLFNLVYRGVGQSKQLENSVRGDVFVQFNSDIAFDDEFLSSQQILNLWQAEAGDFPGAERVIFWGLNYVRGGSAIELWLLSGNTFQLESIATAVKEQLATYAGVQDISDSRGPGKWEMHFRLKPRASSMGIRLDDVARTLRSGYHGDEAMRLQRGRHELQLLVRYPPNERHGLAMLDELHVRRDGHPPVPLKEVVDVSVKRGYSRILRTDQQRAVTIQANVDEEQANVSEITAHLRDTFLPDLLSRHPDVQTRWEGRQQETRESVGSLTIGFAVALFGMFGLLTLEFRSYLQPLLIMAVIPFGITGSVWAHAIFGEPITLFSLLGMVTLSGILANDSIVLIDFINRQRASGESIEDAILTSGRTRFRPVLLTSLTTIAALLPLLLERNTQAQNLIPMALSVAGGLSLATVWVLLLVPVLYRITRADRSVIGSRDDA